MCHNENIRGKYPRKKPVQNHNHKWLKTNGQNNDICYVFSKLYFIQFSEKWKDRIFRFLILFVFVVIVFFDTFVFQHLHRKTENLEMVSQFTRQKKSWYLMMSSRQFKMRQCLRWLLLHAKRLEFQTRSWPMNFVIP